MSEADARANCTKAFENCSVNQINGIPVDPETYIEDCTKDVSVSCLFPVNKTYNWRFLENAKIPKRSPPGAPKEGELNSYIRNIIKADRLELKIFFQRRLLYTTLFKRHVPTGHDVCKG